MAAKKKAAKKKITSQTKTFEVNVVNDSIVKKQLSNNKSILPSNKISATKVYPPIYTYIYEREPEDMARIHKEHNIAQVAPSNKSKQIIGFKVINNKLVAVIKSAKKKK